MVMSWRFMIASSIPSLVLCGVKEFGSNSFEISVLKGVSQSWLSLWRMHNLMDVSCEHSAILWNVSHCGHFVDIDERSYKHFLHTWHEENSVNLLTNLKFGTVVSFSGQSNICLVIFDCSVCKLLWFVSFYLINERAPNVEENCTSVIL